MWSCVEGFLPHHSSLVKEITIDQGHDERSHHSGPSLHGGDLHNDEEDDVFVLAIVVALWLLCSSRNRMTRQTKLRCRLVSGSGSIFKDLPPRGICLPTQYRLEACVCS